MGKAEHWQDRARQLYRVAQSELQGRWSGPQAGDAAFLKEELEEALLDLKQAVIDDQQRYAAFYEHEVNFNLTELRRLARNS